VRFLDHVRTRLEQLRGASLLRSPATLESPTGPTIQLGGRSVLNLCSNDYLGLAADPELLRSLRSVALPELGAGASRLITGTRREHLAAEQALADHVRLPRGLLFSSGYAANVGAIQALLERDDLILSDEHNHASLIDGCRLSRAQVLIYRHLDLDHARALLAEHRGRARAALVITESLFSMDGDPAPLCELRALADDYDAGLLVDEAHALGVHGPEGRGLCARETVVPDILVGTLGKALGLAGAFVAGSEPLLQLVQNRARSHVFSTATPPWLASATLHVLPRIQAAAAERQRLHQHAAQLRERLAASGYDVPDPSRSGWLGPILPLKLGAPEAALAASARLLEAGVFVQAIRPPTVPAGTSRLRITPMASHSSAQIEQAARALEAIRTPL
jgi:8-amino-7-oxononanoate synthase